MWHIVNAITGFHGIAAQFTIGIVLKRENVM